MQAADGIISFYRGPPKLCGVAVVALSNPVSIRWGACYTEMLQRLYAPRQRIQKNMYIYFLFF